MLKAPLAVVMQILSGAVVASGEMKAEITSIGAETFFGKTIVLLGAPEEKGHLFKVTANAPAPCVRLSLQLTLPLCTDAAFMLSSRLCYQSCG